MTRSLIETKHILLLVLIGLAFGLGLFSQELMDLVNMFGRNIGPRYLSGDYLRGFVWAFGVFAVILLFPISNKERKILTTLWAIRVFITLIFMLYYEYHYDLDAFNYYRNAARHLDWFQPAFGFGTTNTIWFAGMVNKFLPVANSYHTLKILWSFMGLLGAYFFYLGFSNYTEKRQYLFLWVVGLLPSVAFWSSTLGKDPIVFFGISLFFYGALGLFKGFKWRYIAVAFIGVFLAASIRIWLAQLLIGPYVLLYALRYSGGRLQKWLVVSVIIVGSVFALQQTMTRLGIQKSDDVLDRANSFSRAWSRGGSAQEAPKFNSVGDIASFAPKGMFTALFRPLPGEVNNMFGVLAGFENMFLLLFFVISLSYMNRELLRDRLVLFCLLFLTSWSLVYGTVSFQNLGTASRFKLQALPALLMLYISVWSYLKPERKEA